MRLQYYNMNGGVNKNKENVPPACTTKVLGASANQKNNSLKLQTSMNTQKPINHKWKLKLNSPSPNGSKRTLGKRAHVFLGVLSDATAESQRDH